MRKTTKRDAHLPEIGFVRLPTILQLIPISRSTFLARVKAGEYPKPYKIGPKVSAWNVDDIRALLSSFKPNEGDA